MEGVTVGKLQSVHLTRGTTVQVNSGQVGGIFYVDVAIGCISYVVQFDG